MGLDAYLYAYRTLSGDWKEEPEEEYRLYIYTLTSLRFPTGKAPKHITYHLEMAWWQSYNSPLFRWFLNWTDADEFKGDDWSPMSRPDLENLKKMSLAELSNPERDKTWDSDFQQAVDAVDQCLGLPVEFSFEYRASW